MNLKPCPFCNGTPDLCVSPGGKHFAVNCKCGVSGPTMRSQSGAVKRWNNRVLHLLDQELEDLRNALTYFIRTYQDAPQTKRDMRKLDKKILTALRKRG